MIKHITNSIKVPLRPLGNPDDRTEVYVSRRNCQSTKPERGVQRDALKFNLQLANGGRDACFFDSPNHRLFKITRKLCPQRCPVEIGRSSDFNVQYLWED